MDETHDEPGKPKDSRPVVRLAGNPDTDPNAARQIHTNALAGGVYANALRHRLAPMFSGMDLAQSAMTYANDLIERMAPRDPLEEMLVVQALMVHARVLHLTDLANQQEQLDSVRTVHEYADRASNTYRRLMLALAEYRKPPRAGHSFTAIKQANIAGQQVVMNGETSRAGKATNEQGDGRDAPTERTAREAPPALPAEPRGAGIPAGIGPAREALGAVYGAEDARGEGPKPDERMEAR